MRSRYLYAVVAFAVATPAYAQNELERGLAGALRGCEEWVLNPKSWADGIAPFVAVVGLGDRMGMVSRIPEVSLPPKQFRGGDHYWRINSTPGAGFFLVVSDQVPMCHITGGGDVDLQPVVSSVLAGQEFGGRWELVKESSVGEMTSSVYRNREEPAFSVVISRAKAPGGRLDHVQVMATAAYNISQ